MNIGILFRYFPWERNFSVLSGKRRFIPGMPLFSHHAGNSSIYPIRTRITGGIAGPLQFPNHIIIIVIIRLFHLRERHYHPRYLHTKGQPVCLLFVRGLTAPLIYDLEGRDRSEAILF
ncbi:MAG: hypothetical protein DRN57_06785 [Thermoplasmata archaeon]|nr:MAG: hypothetical protein DRN57_06785 [Thermoplasmata archaeon]